MKTKPGHPYTYRLYNIETPDGFMLNARYYSHGDELPFARILTSGKQWSEPCRTKFDGKPVLVQEPFDAKVAGEALTIEGVTDHAIVQDLIHRLCLPITLWHKTGIPESGVIQGRQITLHLGKGYHVRTLQYRFYEVRYAGEVVGYRILLRPDWASKLRAGKVSYYNPSARKPSKEPYSGIKILLRFTHGWPQWVAERAVWHIGAQGKIKKLEKGQGAVDAIRLGFSWPHTPEGYDFWSVWTQTLEGKLTVAEAEKITKNNKHTPKEEKKIGKKKVSAPTQAEIIHRVADELSEEHRWPEWAVRLAMVRLEESKIKLPPTATAEFAVGHCIRWAETLEGADFWQAWYDTVVGAATITEARNRTKHIATEKPSMSDAHHAVTSTEQAPSIEVDAVAMLRAAADILEQRGTRYDGKGGRERSVPDVVRDFNEATGRELTVAEGYDFLIALKRTRRRKDPKQIDTYVDELGYLALKLEHLLTEARTSKP